MRQAARLIETVCSPALSGRMRRRTLRGWTVCSTALRGRWRQRTLRG